MSDNTEKPIVIIINDLHSPRELAKAMIARKGIEVLAFNSQEAAMEHLKSHPDHGSHVACILADLESDQGCIGIKGAQELRETCNLPSNLPIVIFSGATDKVIQEKIQEAQGTDSSVIGGFCVRESAGWSNAVINSVQAFRTKGPLSNGQPFAPNITTANASPNLQSANPRQEV